MNNRTRDGMITQLITTLHIFMTALCAVVFMILTGSSLLGIILGVVAWSIVLFKTPLFEWTYFNVKPNWSLIVSNQLKYDTIPKGNAATEMFPLRSMREVGPGVRGRVPGETIYDSIDLRSEVVIGKNEPLECYTADNIRLLISWQAILTPLRGYLVNNVRKGNDATISFFQGEFAQKIISWVKSKDEKDVFKALPTLKTDFTDTFSGPNMVHPQERNYGTFTNTPQIISVSRSPRYGDAAEGQQIGITVAEIISKIKAEFPEVTPDPSMVLAMAAAIAKVELPNLVLIPGLGNVKDEAGLLAALEKLRRKP